MNATNTDTTGDAELFAAYAYILARGSRVNDHGCARCVGAENVVHFHGCDPNFVCVWHRADDYVTNAPIRASSRPASLPDNSAATAVNTADGAVASARIVIKNGKIEHVEYSTDLVLPDGKHDVTLYASPPASASMSAGVNGDPMSDGQIAYEEANPETQTKVRVPWELLPEYRQNQWHRLAAERARANTRAGVDWRHVANEWSDMATNGVQWLRNIRDGISTPADALPEMEANCARIAALSAVGDPKETK